MILNLQCLIKFNTFHCLCVKDFFKIFLLQLKEFFVHQDRFLDTFFLFFKKLLLLAFFYLKYICCYISYILFLNFNIQFLPKILNNLQKKKQLLISSNACLKVFNNFFSEFYIFIALQMRFFKDTQVFKYYKHLLSLSAKGSPASMLKCINPKEAKLLDDASGIHIRFRLMGVCFNFVQKINYMLL